MKNSLTAVLRLLFCPSFLIYLIGCQQGSQMSWVGLDICVKLDFIALRDIRSNTFCRNLKISIEIKLSGRPLTHCHWSNGVKSPMVKSFYALMDIRIGHLFRSYCIFFCFAVHPEPLSLPFYQNASYCSSISLLYFLLHILCVTLLISILWALAETARKGGMTL